MARHHMPQERIIRRILHSYADMIDFDDDGELNYEESCWKIAGRMMETLAGSQQDSIFGSEFDSREECFDYLYRKLPGLHEAMIEFVSDNDVSDE